MCVYVKALLTRKFLYGICGHFFVGNTVFDMDIKFKDNNIIINKLPSFDISDIFDCGQCFRWNKTEDGGYFGIVGNKAMKITQSSDEIVFHNTSEKDFKDIWYDYFDLGRSYENIKLSFMSDSTLSEALEYGSGIRILRQQLWECIVSFIISASNNIPRIKKIVEAFAYNFGEEIVYTGHTYHAFPTPEKTASLSLDDLSIIKAGFRDKYILDAAAKFLTDPKMNTEYLYSVPSAEAKKILMSIKGVGNKVADCVLLFALGKYDCFPIDVWMKRIMEYCYFDGQPQTIPTLAEYAKKRFGNFGGFAQQYLFFYARENKIGI